MKTGALTSLTVSFLILATVAFAALHTARLPTSATMPAEQPAAPAAPLPAVTLPEVTVRPSRADWEAAGISAPSSGGMAAAAEGAAGPNLNMPYYSFGGRLARTDKD